MCSRMRRPLSVSACRSAGLASADRLLGRNDLEDPVHEPQLERAAVPHPADAAIRHGVDRHHRGQVWRVHLRQRVLRTAGIARAEGADLAVGPLLPRDPFDRLQAILGSSTINLQVPSLA